MQKISYTDKIADKWNHCASTYDQEYGHGIRNDYEKELWSNILRKHIGRGNYKVLDVGTGTGNLAMIAAELGHDVKGLDVSKSMITKAIDKANQQSLKIKYGVKNCQELSGEGNSYYDFVISRYVFWTIEDPLMALAEWQRVLKPGGKIIIIDGEWHDRKLVYIIKMLAGTVVEFLTGSGKGQTKYLYDKETKESLPLFTHNILEKTVSYLEQSGLVDISINMLTDLKASEHEMASCKERLLNPQNKYLISAVKAANKDMSHLRSFTTPDN